MATSSPHFPDSCLHHHLLIGWGGLIWHRLWVPLGRSSPLFLVVYVVDVVTLMTKVGMLCDSPDLLVSLCCLARGCVDQEVVAAANVASSEIPPIRHTTTAALPSLGSRCPFLRPRCPFLCPASLSCNSALLLQLPAGFVTELRLSLAWVVGPICRVAVLAVSIAVQNS